jgi:hypothetical protein
MTPITIRDFQQNGEYFEGSIREFVMGLRNFLMGVDVSTPLVPDEPER